MSRLAGKRVAVLATDGFESSELIRPREALWREAAEVNVVALHEGTIQGVRHGTPDVVVDVQTAVGPARCRDYHALVIPGGAASGAALRHDPDVRAFVKDFLAEDKPIAAICHGGWALIDAGAAAGRTLTSAPDIRADLEAAGATWVDREVVVDGLLITSRGPQDLPAFCDAIVEAFERTPVTA